MELKDIKELLSVSLNAANTGSIKLRRKDHKFPAVYILYLEECGMYYIGSTGDLYQRTYTHRLDLRNGYHHNGTFQKCYTNSKDKIIRISFIRVKGRQEGFDLEQLLLDKYINSGLLFNVVKSARTNGLGGKWTPEAKEKQSQVGKNNAETGKLKNAWKSTSRPVTIDGVRYDSISDAARKLGVSQSTLAWRFADLKNEDSNYRDKYFYTP